VLTAGDEATSGPGGTGHGTPAPLLVATIMRPEGGTGVHTHFRELRRFLAARGTSSELVTSYSWHPTAAQLSFAPRLVLDKVSEPAGLAWYFYWHEFFLRQALRRALARGGQAVVYAQGPEVARAAMRARQGPHQRVVLAVHFQTSQADQLVEDGHINSGGRVFRAIRRMEREVIPALDGIIYVSRSARDHLLGWLPEAAAVRSEVVPNFVAPVATPPDQGPLGDLVTVGSLDPRKNHRFLLEVLAAARRKGRSPTLDIFGDGECRKELVELSRALGVADQVRFQGFRGDVRELLPRYRAYVHPARFEILPLALIEALAAGLPVVAGHVGGIPEIYDDGVEGRFWSLDDPVSAAATLLELLDSEPARAKASAAALERYRSNFRADVVVPRLLSFLFAKV
jgi:glycosyltransferase involved in cell wall biosynthesis